MEDCLVESIETSDANNLVEPNVSNVKFSAVELEQFANINPDEKEFSEFRKVTANYPEQV